MNVETGFKPVLVERVSQASVKNIRGIADFTQIHA
jgi:hypothetical protein